MASIRNRPLTARSVLASALLGAEPPELPVAYLVRLAGLFGVNENRARVALSRMAATGEVTVVGQGRYRLAGHLLDRQRRQAASRVGDTGPWRGGWRVVVLTSAGGPAAERRRRRLELRRQRLGELREGVWLRPDNLELSVEPALLGGVEVFHARPAGDAGLARRLWPLDEWAAGATDLMAALGHRPPAGWEDLAPGFELSASVLRHLQSDPLLPDELLPDGWPGPSLRRTYDEWDGTYRELLRAWARSDAPAGSVPLPGRQPAGKELP